MFILDAKHDPMPIPKSLKLRPIEWITLGGFLLTILIVILHGRRFYFLLGDHLGAVKEYASWLLPCFFARIVFSLRDTPRRRANTFYLGYFLLLTLAFFGTRIEQSLAVSMLLKQTLLIVTYQKAINAALCGLTLGYVAFAWQRQPGPTWGILKTELAGDLLAIRLLGCVMAGFIIYSNLLAIVPLIHAGLYDDFFYKVDKLIFFGRDPFPWITSFSSATVRTLMTKSYEFFFFFIVFGLTGTFLLGDLKQYEKTLSGLVLLYLTGLVFFIAWPTVGPAFYGVTASYFRATGDSEIKKYLLDQYKIFLRDPQHAPIGAFCGMAAFPSLHIAHSTFFMICLWRANRWMVALLVVPYLLLGASTVYLGWHYVIDVFGGLALAGFTFWLVERIYASPRPEQTAPTGGKEEKKNVEAGAAAAVAGSRAG